MYKKRCLTNKSSFTQESRKTKGIHACKIVPFNDCALFFSFKTTESSLCNQNNHNEDDISKSLLYTRKIMNTRICD